MSTSVQQSCFVQLPLRTFVFTFFVLSFIVLTDVFVAFSSRSSFIIDVSMRVKTDLSNVFRSLMGVDRVKALTVPINSTFVIQRTGKNAGDNSHIGKLKLLLDKRVNIQILHTNGTHSTPDVLRESGGDKKETTLQYDVLGNPIVQNASNNTRKDNCNNCFKHDFSYVIDNLDICKLYHDQNEIELLIIILTVHKNTLQRKTLRETWLTYSKGNTANVRYAFLLGEVADSKLQEAVYNESQQFRDIIKEDFVDVYSNLTYKTIMGYKWAATKCTKVKAVLKTDDDMYINVPNVLEIVRSNFSLLQSNIVGSCYQRAGPIRSEKSKWFASVNSYPGKFYPGFCSGTGYLTSLNVAQKVYEVSPHVPFFHLEDVYVALCIKKLNYHLNGFPGFNPRRVKLDPCLYNGKTLVTAHYMTPTKIRRVWNFKCTRRSR